MFETAELGRKVGKQEYREREPILRERLLEAQQRLRSAGCPVIVLFGGVDGAGKGDLSNLLNSWMDPRWIVTRAFGAPTQEEVERPAFWRYWRDLPPKGHIGLFLSAWYSRPVLDRVYQKTTDAEFDARLDRIASFERTLADDGALILKFWMHLGRAQQAKRFKQLEKDTLQSWRVSKTDWKHWKKYDLFVEAAERTIARTGMGHAPWIVVEGADERFRSLRVGEVLLEAINHHMDRLEAREKTRAALAVPAHGADADKYPEPVVAAQRTVVSQLDLTLALGKSEYRKQLTAEQARLNVLHRLSRETGTSTVLVFEGVDAAGKGGAIRRVCASLDARAYRVIPVAAPTDEERAQHYLWRFWRHVSRTGRFTIFDRSWYGRVLVERVEGFATQEEWGRAYAEINDFEQQLVDHGIVLVKFWVQISPEEQERRFQARLETPYKRWKMTEEDWRNRARWAEYEHAVHDMVARTSTSAAPWVLVEGEDKQYSRVKVLRSVCDALEKRLS